MAIEWKKNDLPTLAQKVADDASETCQNFIYAGIDVELSDGTQHFSLMPNDQMSEPRHVLSWKTSGAMYSEVPHTTLRRDADEFSCAAKPKSPTLITPCSDRKRLSGLMSR